MEDFFESYRQLVEDHLNGIRSFLTDDTIRRLGWEYNELQNSHPEDSLNVFKMVSDLYYRENFHSDVISVFLDPNANHNEGPAFLFAFIDFLNDKFGNKVTVNKKDYRHAIVDREFQDQRFGKIDICVRSEESRHCIIIENKMYNAADMPRQLPRYYELMTEYGYAVDAIVYLPLDVNKRPKQESWTERDKQNVELVLCQVPAFQKHGISLVNGWLLPCSQLTKNIDCISILRQYSELITTLSNNMMDNVILGKFYNSLLEGDNLQSAISIRNMLNEIPFYMRDRIMEELRNKGINSLWQWRNDPHHCGIIWKRDSGEYKIDIWSYETGYNVSVFGQDIPLAEVPWSADILKSFEKLKFPAMNEGYRKNYSFTEEAKLLEDVELLAHQMGKMFK